MFPSRAARDRINANVMKDKRLARMMDMKKMRFDVKHSFYVGDSLLNLSEVRVQPDSELVGWSLEKLELELGLQVRLWPN